MELKSCDKHFIRTFRGGVQIKKYNIDSRGRPAIRIKTLKDINESEDDRRQGRPLGPMIGHKRVKCEPPWFPVVQRNLRETEPQNVEFVPCVDDAGESDLDDDATTLTQLWKRSQTKQRKSRPGDEISKVDNAYEKPVENDPDLNEPLINWKSKFSKKSKGKRKHMKLNAASSSNMDLGSEQNLVSEDSAPVICVKVEVPDTDQLECQGKSSSDDDDSPIGHNEELNPGDETNELQNMVLSEYREPLPPVHEYQDSGANETSWDDFEDARPIAMLFPGDGNIFNSEIVELGYEDLLDVLPLAIKNREETGEADSWRVPSSEDHVSDGYGHSRSSASMKEISEQRSSSGIQVPDMGMRCQQEYNLVLFEDKSKADSPYEQDDSSSIPEKNCGSYLDSVIPLKTENIVVPKKDAVVDAGQPSACPMNAITKNGLNYGSQLEDELPKAERGQTSASLCPDAESKSPKNQTSDTADTFSTPESHQSSERLLSTGKAISPSSREQLFRAMNSVELCNATNRKRKGNLFEEQTGKKISPVKSETPHAKLAVNHGRPGKISQRKVTISPRNIIKKSQIGKGSLEGPRFSRTLPKLSTGCASIQGCSENAIAFSQRQMHDMESLAVKLMNELKSMKDIVEQKLLFEAYRNVSLKNDADEVKSVINNATRVEETAKKWMSIMTRDCNRFCKIMKMTPDNNTASSPKDTIPRGKKKIVFADEAGGKLCHVKYLEDCEASSSCDHTQN